MFAITYHNEQGDHLAPYLFEHFKDALKFTKKMAEHIRLINIDYRGFEARKVKIEETVNIMPIISPKVPHVVGYNVISYQQSNYGQILTYIDVKYMPVETFKDADEIGYKFL